MMNARRIALSASVVLLGLAIGLAIALPVRGQMDGIIVNDADETTTVTVVGVVVRF